MSNSEVRQAVLEAGCFQYPEEVVFAGGEPANNKLDLDQLERHHCQRLIVARALGELAAKYNPDLLMGVPSGGDKLITSMQKAGVCEWPTARLWKQYSHIPGFRRFSALDPHEDGQAIAGAERIVLVEDVGNEYTSSNGVLRSEQIPNIREKIVALVGVWVRSRPEQRRSMGKASVEWLVDEYIPPMIKPDHPLLYQAKELQQKAG